MSQINTPFLNVQPVATPVSTAVQQQNAPPAQSQRRRQPAGAPLGPNENQQISAALEKYGPLMPFTPKLEELHKGMQDFADPQIKNAIEGNALAGRVLVENSKKTFAELQSSGEIEPNANPWLIHGAKQAEGVMLGDKYKTQLQSYYNEWRLTQDPNTMDQAAWEAEAAKFKGNFIQTNAPGLSIWGQGVFNEVIRGASNAVDFEHSNNVTDNNLTLIQNATDLNMRNAFADYEDVTRGMGSLTPKEQEALLLTARQGTLSALTKARELALTGGVNDGRWNRMLSAHLIKELQNPEANTALIEWVADNLPTKEGHVLSDATYYQLARDDANNAIVSASYSFTPSQEAQRDAWFGDAGNFDKNADDYGIFLSETFGITDPNVIAHHGRGYDRLRTEVSRWGTYVTADDAVALTHWANRQVEAPSYEEFMASKEGQRIQLRIGDGPGLTRAVFENTIRDKYWQPNRLTEDKVLGIENGVREMLVRVGKGGTVPPEEVLSFYRQFGDLDENPQLLAMAQATTRQTRPNWAADLQMTNEEWIDLRDWAISNKPSQREIAEKIADTHRDPNAHGQHIAIQRSLEALLKPPSVSSLQSNLKTVVPQSLTSIAVNLSSQHAPTPAVGFPQGPGVGFQLPNISPLSTGAPMGGIPNLGGATSPTPTVTSGVRGKRRTFNRQSYFTVVRDLLKDGVVLPDGTRSDVRWDGETIEIDGYNSSDPVVVDLGEIWDDVKRVEVDGEYDHLKNLVMKRANLLITQQTNPSPALAAEIKKLETNNPWLPLGEAGLWYAAADITQQTGIVPTEIQHLVSARGSTPSVVEGVDIQVMKDNPQLQVALREIRQLYDNGDAASVQKAEELREEYRVTFQGEPFAGVIDTQIDLEKLLQKRYTLWAATKERGVDGRVFSQEDIDFFAHADFIRSDPRYSMGGRQDDVRFSLAAIHQATIESRRKDGGKGVHRISWGGTNSPGIYDRVIPVGVGSMDVINYLDTAVKYYHGEPAKLQDHLDRLQKENFVQLENGTWVDTSQAHQDYSFSHNNTFSKDIALTTGQLTANLGPGYPSLNQIKLPEMISTWETHAHNEGTILRESLKERFTVSDEEFKNIVIVPRLTNYTLAGAKPTDFSVILVEDGNESRPLGQITADEMMTDLAREKQAQWAGIQPGLPRSSYWQTYWGGGGGVGLTGDPTRGGTGPLVAQVSQDVAEVGVGIYEWAAESARSSAMWFTNNMPNPYYDIDERSGDMILKGVPAGYRGIVTPMTPRHTTDPVERDEFGEIIRRGPGR